MEDTMVDYEFMRQWFAEPELQEWVWCDKKGEPPVTIEQIIHKYGDRIKNPTTVFPYFILQDQEPIGYMQYYIQDQTIIGIDMWIGVLQERNHGIGTEALKQMVELIHNKYPDVKHLIIDPEIANKRAIKCYQNAGFKSTGEVIDGTLILRIDFKEK